MSSEESAVAKPSAGWGGFGDLDEKALLESVKGSEVQRGSATAEDIRDAMGNVMPTLEKVKVKHGGACIFVFEDEKKVEKLIGSVIAYSYHNSFFDKAFEDREEGERPPCFSNDGATVSLQAEGPKHTGCQDCPHNRDAVDKDARELAFKAKRKDVCRNYLSLAVALPGRDVPVLVRLSNTSFKPWAAYVQKIGTEGRFKSHEVVTEFSLVNRKGAGDSDYSVVHFKNVGALPAEIAGQFAEQAENYRSLLRRDADRPATDDDESDAAAAVADAKKAQKRAKRKGSAL